MKISRTGRLLAFAFLVVAIGVAQAADTDAPSSIEQHYAAVIEAHRVIVVAESKKIEEKQSHCSSCKGKGIVSEESVCMACKGFGLVAKKRGQATLHTECQKCHGNRTIIRKKPCRKCRPYAVKKEGDANVDKESKTAKPADEKPAETIPKCASCSGKGYFVKKTACPSCGGKGMVKLPPKKLVSGWSDGRISKCTACNSKGSKTERVKCKDCKGKGLVKANDAAQSNPEMANKAKDATPKDVPEIVKWFRHAAQNGDVKAQYCLGVICAAGEGIDKDPAEAVKWFSAAASKGNSASQFLLGESYAAGVGVAKDKAEAEKWIQKASESGYDKAQCERGIALMRAKETPEKSSVAKEVPASATAGNPKDAAVVNSKATKEGGYCLVRDIDREHDAVISHVKHHSTTFQVRALLGGGYNYVIYDHWESYFPIAAPVNQEGYGEISMVVFNDSAMFDASEAFKEAVEKVRKWLEAGSKNNATLPDFKDMDIDVPAGCALKIPNAVDKWLVFKKIADIPAHKPMATRFQFRFSGERRCLRLLCGKVAIAFEWNASDDERELAALEAKSDSTALLSLLRGNAGEWDAFDVSQAYEEIPTVPIDSGKAKPEWTAGDISFLPDFACNTSVALSRCPNGSYNYTFSSHTTRHQYNTMLIFPNSSYDAAYSAMVRAYRIALAWRDVARSRHVMNLFKEIEIPCPPSVGIQITGLKGINDLWWDSVVKEYPASETKRTRFWLTIDTPPTSGANDGTYHYKEENTRYYFCYGNDDILRALEIDDETTAVFKCIDPRLGLKKAQEKAMLKVKESEIFN